MIWSFVRRIVLTAVLVPLGVAGARKLSDTVDVWTLQLGEARQISADTAYVDANTVETDRNPGGGCGFEGRASIGLYVIRHDHVWLVDRAESQLVGDGPLRYPDTARCTKAGPASSGS